MKHIVGFSGGIDSQACCGWVLERFPKQDVIITNSDAGGNEHPLTVAHVKWYSEHVHPVLSCNALVSDMWATPHFAETKGYRSDDKLTFGTMIEIKGRPPASQSQFCTDYLKIKPAKRWMEIAFGPTGPYAGEDYIRYTGVRKDESKKRRNLPEREWDTYFDCELVRPIFLWTKPQCFDFVKARGEAINPLYLLGFNRVGCAPCINANKDDIRNWAERFPEMIDKVRGWEADSGRTFFAPIVPGKAINWIDEVVEWARTSRGGRQKLLPMMHERPACESKYGLCE